MTRETVGPTFKRVILGLLAIATAGAAGAGISSSVRGETAPDPGPKAEARLVRVETEMQTLRADFGRRLERIEDKLDRLIERK